ncbi:hypothetical protein A2713_02425 [candidate division WWE3 bacterium RIFCSPHIGHO2_01_FULL_35_17]|uniref:CHRD domain-containing protein n=1 Tax=candidate division WWE3 bacterium RIFCSPHIGHO2_01_FULL_35_17 TaxID=1802614 RepID=A0A1F4USV8_UNCKA|nr:MAG: hypothetical protein A2713_02425 [candidate division WWE3 bacterium RIFCSPHIGHO2_01_FULL_35_17]
MKNNLILIIVLVVAVLVGYMLVSKSTNPVDTVDTVIVNENVDDSVVPTLDKSLTVLLLPVETSDVTQSGTARFEENEDGVTVTVNIIGYETEATQPMHLHQGGCPGVGQVVYPLEEVVNGTSTTVLQGVTMEMLKGELPLALNVHKSVAEISVYTTCGDISL